MTLADKKCIPCEVGTMPLTIQEASALVTELHDWTLSPDAKKLTKTFKTKDFADALALTNKIGAAAEEENHHPDITLSWGRVGIELSTHKIGGLSENDFILAAKIDQLT